MKHKHIQHLYWRTGFGILPAPLNTLSKNSKIEIVEHLFKASKSVTPLKVDTSEINALFASRSDFTKENRKKFQEISRKKRIELNVAWIGRLANTDELLREKMTLFWANHFVCEDNNILFIQQFNNTLRKHALGNFRDFVKAISKEAAMTKYLNTKQNRKQKPNENFARELMELFTLGVGNYTEQDIKESARAFTGYNHNFKGEFVLRKALHDTGNKTFFGKTGNFDGEAIIDIILEKEQCARYICEKIYKYFVSDVVRKEHIDEMVGVFYPNYNIEKLMRHLFLSDWFYDDENIGTKIKSPIEFLVGINGIVPVQFKNSRQLLYIQKVLGQTLLNPPNVAGWKGGRSWIDSNTIMFRLKLPSVLLNNAYISKIEADDSDSMMAMSSKNRNKNNRFKVEANWNVFNTNFKEVSLEALENHLLQCHINSKTEDYLQSLKKGAKRDYCIQLMSLPEYQMC
ncbi:DUF1800 domain-containing protein [Flavivirga jejuensis]|uniref:DUF1800 domain-containing protein n=1 Tax=Flavivirga jejuensis TaxID=870487 RepID=A0ABT8WR71_9FLAO|nr:DUF1800 domain-containing protein [Flavivirga jejuensis]MDO5975663.1 DUF1800 domain-containing protein [Flavivirga jejuensis]